MGKSSEKNTHSKFIQDCLGFNHGCCVQRYNIEINKMRWQNEWQNVIYRLMVQKPGNGNSVFASIAILQVI